MDHLIAFFVIIGRNLRGALQNLGEALGLDDLAREIRAEVALRREARRPR